ncbi:hypothetical protein ACFLXE_07095 [Chloroflexota bacterium]
MEERFIKHLLSSQRCNRCGSSYEPADAELLGYEGGWWVFFVLCPSCKSQGLVLSAGKEAGARELDTGLAEAEKDRFSTPIDSNDVIDMHTFLKEFSGDFASIFSCR